MWFEDNFNKQKELDLIAYRRIVEEQANIQIGVDFNNLLPLKLHRKGDYEKEWRVVESPSRSTNDACEHYIHKHTKAHYTMCYFGGKCVWSLEETYNQIQMEEYTYSAGLISEWLKENKIPFKPRNSSMDSTFCLYNHGIQATLASDILLSIQTHYMIAGPCFAETALIINGKLTYDGELGYDDVMRHSTPTELFDHISEVLKKIQKRKEVCT
jgi:hypothetical protein